MNSVGSKGVCIRRLFSLYFLFHKGIYKGLLQNPQNPFQCYLFNHYSIVVLCKRASILGISCFILKGFGITSSYHSLAFAQCPFGSWAYHSRVLCCNNLLTASIRCDGNDWQMTMDQAISFHFPDLADTGQAVHYWHLEIH